MHRLRQDAFTKPHFVYIRKKPDAYTQIRFVAVVVHKVWISRNGGLGRSLGHQALGIGFWAEATPAKTDISKSMRNTFFILPLLCLFPCFALSQSAFRSYQQFDKTYGLNSPVISMAQDDDGFFWLATQNGYFRFDGVRATEIPLPVPDSLEKFAKNTYQLCYDRKNQTIWLGTAAGIFRHQLNSAPIEHLQPNAFFKEKDLNFKASRVVFADPTGQAWGVFGKYGLAKIPQKGHKVETYYLPLNEREKTAGFDEKMANTLKCISQDPNHENLLWVCTRRGIMKFDKASKRLERFIYYPENKEMLVVANAMTCHYAHPNGYIYIGTWDAGLLKLDPKNGSFTQFLRTPAPWKKTVGNTYRITSIVPDKDGNLWTDGSGGGSLFDVATERFRSLPVEGFNIDFQDRDGHYWQFKAGLRLYHRIQNQGQRIEFPPTLPCETFSGTPYDSLHRDIYFRGNCNDGAFWAFNIDKALWHHFPLVGKAGQVVTLSGHAQGPTGYFVIESVETKLYLRESGSDHFQKLPVEFPANSGNLNMACSPSGDLYITGHEGWLFWLKPPNLAAGKREWTIKSFYKKAMGGTLPDDFFCTSEPTFDHLGRLWMRTCEGFSIFSPETGRFQHFSKKQEGLRDLRSYEFFLLDQQRMWVAGNGGFGWLDANKPEAGLQKSFKPEGTFRHELYGIEFIIDGKIWLLTNNGWAEFDPETEKYRYFDFLKVNHLFHAGKGKLAAISGNNVLLFQSDSLKTASETPKPYVSWFKVFEKPLAMSGSLLSPEPIRLKADENFFSIGYSALALYEPSGIRFAYQLQGVNQDWVYAEPGNWAASFTNIAGGDYVFKLKTTNNRGEWLNNTFELKIHVETPWWKTVWFGLAIMAVLGTIVFLIVKNFLHQQKILMENQRLQLDQEMSLRNERDRIASEMHDDLGAGLSTIRFLSLAAKEHEADPAKAARIDKIATHAAQVMEKMADIIWVMNSRNDTLENFAAYLRRYAGELLETHGIQFIFENPGGLPDRKLSGELRRTMLLAVKECLHNVIKHANATEVKLLLVSNGQLEISVEDNGKGLPAHLTPRFGTALDPLTSNGLHNIRQRMEALGGRAIFDSGPGTKVSLQIPMPRA